MGITCKGKHTVESDQKSCTSITLTSDVYMTITREMTSQIRNGILHYYIVLNVR